MPEENEPCQQEPCKSAVAASVAAATTAQDAQNSVTQFCFIWGVLKWALIVTLFNFWATMAALMVCWSQLSGIPAIVCQAFIVIAAVLVAAIVFLLAALSITFRGLNAAQIYCHAMRRDNALKYLAMRDACGVECVPFIDVNCFCN
jgi:hypothetical protein